MIFYNTDYFISLYWSSLFNKIKDFLEGVISIFNDFNVIAAPFEDYTIFVDYRIGLICIKPWILGKNRQIALNLGICQIQYLQIKMTMTRYSSGDNKIISKWQENA